MPGCWEPLLPVRLPEVGSGTVNRLVPRADLLAGDALLMGVALAALALDRRAGIFQNLRRRSTDAVEGESAKTTQLKIPQLRRPHQRCGRNLDHAERGRIMVCELIANRNDGRISQNKALRESRKPIASMVLMRFGGEVRMISKRRVMSLGTVN